MQFAPIIFLTLAAITFAALVWQNHEHQKKVMSALNDRLRLLLLESAVNKIGTESTATLAEIIKLREQIESGAIPADALETLARIEARVRVIDEHVPDAPPAPAPEG